MFNWLLKHFKRQKKETLPFPTFQRIPPSVPGRSPTPGFYRRPNMSDASSGIEPVYVPEYNRTVINNISDDIRPIEVINSFSAGGGSFGGGGATGSWDTPAEPAAPVASPATCSSDSYSSYSSSSSDSYSSSDSSSCSSSSSD